MINNISNLQVQNKINSQIDFKNSRDKDGSNAMPAQRIKRNVATQKKEDLKETISLFKFPIDRDSNLIEKQETVIKPQNTPSKIQFRGNLQNEAYFYYYKSKGISNEKPVATTDSTSTNNGTTISSGVYYGKALLFYKGF